MTVLCVSVYLLPPESGEKVMSVRDGLKYYELLSGKGTGRL